MRKIRKLNKLKGDIPFFYSRETIYLMCILINALVDRVNYMADELYEMRKED